jgi:hypothetical protein
MGLRSGGVLHGVETRGLCRSLAGCPRIKGQSADVAQWQSSCFVNSRPSVRIRPSAPQFVNKGPVRITPSGLFAAR